MNSRLGRLGLLFPVHVGNQRDVDESKVLIADAELELPHSFDKWCRFDIAHSTTELIIGKA